MARLEVTGRASLGGSRPRKSPAYGKTPAQFQADYGISRSTWNNWKKNGTGPAVTQPAGPGGRQIITPESEAAWKREHTALATAAE